MLQLRMTMAELQRQVHEEDRALFELELDDEALDALVEVVKPLAVNARSGQERVALLAQNRQPMIQRTGAVLALVYGVVAQRTRDDVGLVDVAGPDRARVDLDEADDIGILRL